MPSPPFLTGGGVAGARLRDFDWSTSPLGPPEHWSPALVTLVGVVLNAPQPMLLAWGERLVCLHNDAHAALLGEAQPDTLGRPLSDAWPDRAETIAPLVRRALGGEASRVDDLRLPRSAENAASDAHVSLSLSPVRDGAEVGGVLCLLTETTGIVRAERRKAFLLDLSDRLRLAEEPRGLVAAAVQALGRHLKVDRVGYGEVQPDGRSVRLESSFADGVVALRGLVALDAYGPDTLARLGRGETVAEPDIALVKGEDQDAWRARQTRAFVIVPSIRENRFRASLYVSCNAARAWSPDDVSLVEEVAARVWDALERARAEEALRLSEARFRAAVTAVSGILWTNNAAGHMEGEQVGWGTLTGQTRDQYTGYGWADAVHPEDAPPTLAAWHEAVERKGPFVFEHRVRRFDGTWRVFAVRAIPVLDAADDIQEWVGVHSDITEQRAAEHQLRRLNKELVTLIAEERDLNRRLAAQGAALLRAQDSLQAIFTASSEGLTLCRAVRDAEARLVDYQVLDANPAHAALTGATREEMLARPVGEINPARDPRWMVTADAAIRTGTPQGFEVRSPITGRWLDIRVSPVSGDLFAQTFIDVTARYEAEEHRSRLIAEMNHRVMNNFQMVASLLDLQARRSRSEEVREQLGGAVKRVHLLAQLHERLALSPDLGTMDVEAYLSAVCERLRGLITDPDRIRLTLFTEPAALDASYAIPIGFVVNELVTNAIKYAFPVPAQGEISVSFSREGPAFALCVADGGAGLPAGVEAKGTGLGMRLVSQFVRQIGGTLDVERSPGVRYRIRFGLSPHEHVKPPALLGAEPFQSRSEPTSSP